MNNPHLPCAVVVSGLVALLMISCYLGFLANRARKRWKRSAKFWEDEASRFCRNEFYYTGLLDQIAKNFGKDAYISDDGSVQQDPLRAKMPELVQSACVELVKYRDAYQRADGVVKNYLMLQQIINAWDHDRTNFHDLKHWHDVHRTDFPWERPFSIALQLVDLYCAHSIDMVRTHEALRLKTREALDQDEDYLIVRDVLKDIDRHFGCNHVETNTPHVLVTHVGDAVTAAAFFASCIKCGEKWTDKCQEAYDSVFGTKP